MVSIAKQALDIKDVAAMLGLSTASVRRAWRKGDLCEPVRVGPRCIRWMRSDLDRWAESLPRVPYRKVRRAIKQAA